MTFQYTVDVPCKFTEVFCRVNLLSIVMYTLYTPIYMLVEHFYLRRTVASFIPSCLGGV